MTTPGQFRQFATKALHEASGYREWAHAAHDPERKRYFLRCAEGREDHAEWYLSCASRGEIEVESFKEAAE